MRNAGSAHPTSGRKGQTSSTPANGRMMVGASRFQTLLEFVRNLDLVQTVSLLTVTLFLIFSLDHWLFIVVSRICFLIFILRPSSIRRSLFWFVIALAGTITIVLIWERVDNHKYLLVYWTWVLFVVHLFKESEQQKSIIRINARFFLCLIFLAASAQKLSSPSYRSGEMFEHYFYVDGRFTAFGKLIGIDPAVGDDVKRRINYLRSPFAEVDDNDIHVRGSDRARMAAVTMTWWDVGLQLSIGLLLLFGRGRTDEIAHLLLVFFIFTTYLPAPVYGFGWILAIMGFALAKDRFPKIAVGYMLSFFAILLYQLPWRDWVLGS